ncbi:MAG: serine hydrolase [Planctomycetaceae bacterium]|nr:MAG: serine hydrolase [Planctomycetaceae bacterium]
MVLRPQAPPLLLIVAGWLVTIAAIGSVRSAAAAEPDYSAAIRQLEAAIRYEVEQKNIPAFSIALVDDDRTVWSAGFGFQDADRTVPATSETVYRVGSISKLFTDIAVMRLVEAGQLDLDAPIQTYLPEFRPHNPHNDKPLTLRQMLAHQSGLVRESPVGNYFDPTEPTLEATIASLNDTSLTYPPETKTKYSNAAIAVVGAALERASGRSHPDLVRDELLGPLAMDASSFVVTPEVRQRLAAGWMWTYDGRRFVAPEFLLGTGPAGNLYSSVDDLAKFIQCLFAEGQTSSGPLIQPKTLRLMTTPVTDPSGRPQTFGLGFSVRSLDGHTKIGHGGAVYGFSTQLEALPQRKLGVVAAASLDGVNGLVERLADHALRLMLATQDGQPLPQYHRTRELDAERAERLVGEYLDDQGNSAARITRFGDTVYLRRGTFQRQLRASESDGTVVIDDVFGFGPTVQPTADGGLRIGNVALTRGADPLPPRPSQTWFGLIGEYGWDHNTLYILEDAGQLVALIEWFYYYPLREITPNRYAFPDFGLYHGEELIFTRDEFGQASQVVAADVTFVRRPVGTADGDTFRIDPLVPIDQLRDAARQATPPNEPGPFREPELVELITLDPTIRLDIRYAGENNFTGARFYDQPRAFLQRPAAEAVVRVQQALAPAGLGLLVHDAYRPWYVTKMFWEATPEHLRDFVANPARGSRHNRGCAVDLTLCDLATGQPVTMGAGYDEFTNRSYPRYPGGTSMSRWNRERLRRAMESEGFEVYEFEWWHFDYQDWQQYPIGNATFEQLSVTPNLAD